MHWVYVLESSEGDIYVGETTRLYRRWSEHQTGRGGANTSQGNYTKIIGLYSVGNNSSFIEYKNTCWKLVHYWGQEDKDNALKLENIITQRYLVERGITNSNIRGGSYTTETRCENFCYGKGNIEYVKDRPLCKCGYPCEVNIKNDKTKIYFTCPLSKVNNWEGFYSGLIVPEKCNFWQEYEPFTRMKEDNRKRIAKQCEWWVSRLPDYDSEPCIKCESENYKPVWSRGIDYRVCMECFHEKFDALKEEYMDKPRNIAYLFDEIQ